MAEKTTVDGVGPVASQLKEKYSSLERIQLSAIKNLGGAVTQRPGAGGGDVSQTVTRINPTQKSAMEIGANIAHHPQNIGGRYSCFSIVGMLPAILCGLNAKKIRDGAKKVVEEFLDGNNKIIDSCATQLYFYKNGHTNSVIMPYIDSLKNFTDWYRQLWAESLGKSGFGSTPINSMGTVDQHSQFL